MSEQNAFSASQAGFTLMELLVAMALAAIVGLAVYSLSSSVMGAYDQVRKVRARDYGFTMLGEVLREDLRAVYPGDAKHDDFVFIGDDYSGRDDPFMSFCTASTLNLKAPEGREGLYVVRYIMKRDEDSDSLNFIREERDYAGLETNAEWRSVVVAKNISEFEVEYAEPARREWISEWRTPTTGKLGVRLPHAVRMKLVFVHAPELTKELLVLLPEVEYNLIKSAY